MTAARQPHAFARTDSSWLGLWWWTTDHILLGVAAILMTLGVLLSFASSPAAAARMNLGDPFHFAMRQSVFAVIGAAILLGVSALSRHTLTAELATGELTLLDVAGFPVRRSWYAAYPSGKQLSIIARTFQDYLLAEGKGLVDTYYAHPSP